MEATKVKLLFTPGPLSTSPTVKQKMLADYGSRDAHFVKTVKEIRTQILEIASLKFPENYTTVLMQGSGTFGVESVLQSSLPKNGKLLIVVNGAYGERMIKMADTTQLPYAALHYDENQFPDEHEIEIFLSNNPDITHIAIVHCETTSGIFNPIEKIGALAKKYNKTYLVDAMSSFGAVPINMEAAHIDYLVSSSNKCIEGVPGFSFVIALKKHLENCKGNSRSLSLDLYEQWEGLEKNGQFRFTPPVQVLMAFHQALKELIEEGGVKARAARYQNNCRCLLEGMTQLGFVPYLSPEKQGYIIHTFYFPEHPNFHFETFYNQLNEKGFVIYPGKLTRAACFRIGNIGQLFENDMQDLLEAIAAIKKSMNF